MNDPDTSHHLPVLPDVVREAFRMPPGTVVDATAGGGGHTALLRSLGHTVLANDRDPRARARLARRFQGDPGVRVHAGDFRSLAALDPVDGLLADLGLSSDQLDHPESGFSFLSASMPDMRMDPGLPRTAARLIEESDPASLARILADFGEEPRAGRIARALAGRRFDSCRELAEVVRVSSGYHSSRTNPATRTFQALRIAVNDELGQLESLLAAAPTLVRPGGRIVFISFHSLEDRLVKRAMTSWAGVCTCPPGLPVCRCGVKPCAKPLWKGYRAADDREVAENPRARSARIRGVERV